MNQKKLMLKIMSYYVDDIMRVVDIDFYKIL